MPCYHEIEVNEWVATLSAVDDRLLDDVEYAKGKWWEIHEESLHGSFDMADRPHGSWNGGGSFE